MTKYEWGGYESSGWCINLRDAYASMAVFCWCGSGYSYIIFAFVFSVPLVVIRF